MSTNIETIPFSFEEIYADIEQKFKDKGYDAIYEGSNTAQLITAMSYLTSMLNTNTAININETLLTAATKRDNILKDARILGYEIAHTTSYRYNLTLTYEVSDAHSINKNEEFSADGNTYYAVEQVDFVGDTVTIEVIEGDIKTFGDNQDTLKVITTTITNDDGSTEPQYYIDIPFLNVEDDGIEVFLTYYDDLGELKGQEPWYKSDQFMIDKDTVLDNEYIRLDNIEYKMPRIYFKLAGVGPGIRLGTIVEMNVMISKGEEGEMFTIPSTTLPNVTVSSFELISQGNEEESAQSIKDNAPLFHNSANRVITKSDYIAMCNRQTTVKSTEVWDGDLELVPVPGHIWFSFLPTDDTANVLNQYQNDPTNEYYLVDQAGEDWFLEDVQIENPGSTPGVWDILNQYKVPTLVFNNRHPLYINFDYNISIMKYIIKTTKEDIYQDVFNIIQRYFEGVDVDGVKAQAEILEKFDVEYFNSNLIKRIDSDLTDVTGVNLDLTTEIMISSYNINNENVNDANQSINIPLSSPYEDYYVNDAVLTNMLPQIDTLRFTDVQDLEVDWSSELNVDDENIKYVYTINSNSRLELFVLNTAYVQNNQVEYLGITYNLDVATDDGTVAPDTNVNWSVFVYTQTTIQIGTYTLFNDVRTDIIVDLYVNGTGEVGVVETADGLYATSTLLVSDFVTQKYINLVNYSSNFKTIKNCVPRLNKATFN